MREKLSTLLSRIVACMIICQHLTGYAASKDSVTSSNSKLWEDDNSATEEDSGLSSDFK